MIAKGQIYQYADPRENIRIRILGWTVGHTHAWVEDAYSGKRQRWLNVRFLHASPTTKTGAKRRTGYILQPGASE